MSLPEYIENPTTTDKFEGLVAMETRRKGSFESMSNEDFARYCKSIFITMIDFGGMTQQQIDAVQEVFMVLMGGDIPESAYGIGMFGGETLVAWIACLQELVERIQRIDAAGIPISARVEVIPVESEETDQPAAE